MAIDKDRVIQGFDNVAEHYNSSVLRFFPFCADRVVDILRPKPQQKILDVATGTGALALACAQAVHPAGRVIGIDLSEAMLEQAMQTARKMGLDNIDWFDMDAEALQFKNNYIDAVICSFGLFFLPDMSRALKEWRRVAKPGGKVLFTSFAPAAFQPMLGIMLEALRAGGVELPEPALSSHRLNQREQCQALMDEAGLSHTCIDEIQVGYHLQNVDEWWGVIWGSAMRHLVLQLPQPLQAEFKSRHLQAIQELMTDKGLWLDVPVYVSQGQA